MAYASNLKGGGQPTFPSKDAKKDLLGDWVSYCRTQKSCITRISSMYYEILYNIYYELINTFGSNLKYSTMYI